MVFFREKPNTHLRAEYSLSAFPEHFEGKVLDIGAGGSTQYFKERLGDRYYAADVSQARHKPDIFLDFEKDDLPLEDNSFDTVLSFDCLEHLDDIHHMFDELLRVSKKNVIISLPNNWSNFSWSLLRGHNLTHQVGYGLPLEPQAKGVRHKWWFNAEEAEKFVRYRAAKNNAEVKLVRFVFDSGDAFIRIPGLYPEVYFIKPHTIANLANRDDIAAKKSIYKLAVNVAKVLPKWAPKLIVWTLRLALLPIKILDEILKALIWGWGSRYRFLNAFSQQAWFVIEKKS